MHKYYLTAMSRKIPHTLLYDREMKFPPGLTKKMISDANLKHGEILSGRGSLMNKVDEALMSLPMYSADGMPLYMLLPINLMLWIYELGNDEKESLALYDTIFVESRKLYMARGADKRRIKLADMPISRRLREYLGNANYFHNPQNRKFLHMQALITVLCCAVRAAHKQENELAHEILDKAAPKTVGSLGTPFVNGEPTQMYSAIYNGGESVWNIMLLRACLAGELVQFLRSLVWRAKTVMARPDEKHTATISRKDFYRKLLCYLELSAKPDPLMCMDMENMAGIVKVW